MRAHQARVSRRRPTATPVTSSWAPGSAKFLIIYEASPRSAPAPAFFNFAPQGLHRVRRERHRARPARPLAFKVVSGESAKTTGLPDADPTYDYIRVELAHPVPPDGGQARMRIVKTYDDAKSYRLDGQDLVFDRGLSIKKNAVVPAQGPSWCELQLSIPRWPRRPTARIASQLLQRHARRGAPLKLRAGGEAVGRALKREEQVRRAGQADPRHRLFPAGPADPRLHCSATTTPRKRPG